MLRRSVKALLERCGYRLTRSHHLREIDLFDLLVRHEMQMTRKRPFFFLQIGANDGELNDPIHRYVETYHWAGLLVEPVPHFYGQLQRAYGGNPQLSFANVAIGPTDRKLTMYTLPDLPSLPAWARGITTTDRARLLWHRRLAPAIRPEIIETIEVTCWSMQSLVTHYDVTYVDLLQIDTEGDDLKVLKAFDFMQFKPRIVQFEHRHLALNDQATAIKLLKSHGYRLSTQHDDTIAHLANCG